MGSAVRCTPLDQRLEGCASNTYTQFGEDGIIQRVFELIGESNRWSFEVGASDGKRYSNTLRLRQQGWSAVLMEADDALYQRLLAYKADNVFCVHMRVADIDSVLAACDAPGNLDLGVIDVDGPDYWLWHDMQLFRPRVMLVEFHWAKGEQFIPQRGSLEPDQAGKEALIELGTQKGYTAVAQTYVNLLFVDTATWNQV